MHLKNKGIFVMSDNPASSKGILRKYDEKKHRVIAYKHTKD